MLGSAVRSRAALIAGAAGVAALLAGCGTGQQTHTASKEPSVPGVNVTVGDIDLRNLQVTYPGRETRVYPQGGNAPLEIRIFNNGTSTYTLTEVTTDAAESVVLVDNPDNPVPGACPAPTVSASPAEAPTEQPTESPTAQPTGSPTAQPTESPTPEPTETAETPEGPSGSDEFAISIGPDGCALLDNTGRYYLELAGLSEELAPGDTVEVTFTFTSEDGGEPVEVTARIPMALPSDGPEHSPMDIHPEEPTAVAAPHRGTR